MDEAEIRKLISDTAQTTATAVTARYEAARQDLHQSEGYLSWKALTPKMRRRAGVIALGVFIVGLALGVLLEHHLF